jgi:hypothetical protein
MNEDLMIQKILKLEEDVETVKKKIAKVDLLDNVLKGQDKMITLLQTVRQEQTFMYNKIDRLEYEVNKIKLHLQLA